MEQYSKVQQLMKKEDGHKDRKPVYPYAVIQAVFDAKTGASLEAILAQFNSLYVQYQGTPKDTRLVIPMEMRRAGLTITYMNMDSETITERASSAVQKDNDHWGLDTNWSRVDELSLSGDIAVSANGTWIINGEDTGVKAVGPKGDTGLTPWLKTIDNKLHFSYDNVNWEECSEDIAAYFRFLATSSDSQAESVGKIQISRDNKTWTDLSPEFRNYLRIQGYVATTSALPANQVVGTIYGVGPTYAEEDTEQTNPIYRIYVYDGNSWVDNGSFTSIAAGVVQETGDSETEVMSQKAVSDELSELGSEMLGIDYKKATRKIISFPNDGYYIDSAGDLIVEINSGYTELIPVLAGQTLVIQGVGINIPLYTEYTSAGVFVSSSQKSDGPSNVYVLRFTSDTYIKISGRITPWEKPESLPTIATIVERNLGYETDKLVNRMEFVDAEISASGLIIDSEEVTINTLKFIYPQGNYVDYSNSAAGVYSMPNSFTPSYLVLNKNSGEVSVDSSYYNFSDDTVVLLYKSKGLYVGGLLFEHYASRMCKHMLINIHMGQSGTVIGATNVGDVTYITNPESDFYRKLRRCMGLNSEENTFVYETVPYYNGAIYTYMNKLYVYNGEELEEVTKPLENMMMSEIVRHDEDINGAVIGTDISSLLSWIEGAQTLAVKGGDTELGEVVSLASGKRDASDFYDVGSAIAVKTTLIHPASTSSNGGLVFYDENHIAIEGHYLNSNTSDSYTEATIDIPANAKYFRTTRWNIVAGIIGEFKCVLVESKTTGLKERVSKLESPESGIIANPIIGSPELYISEPTEFGYIDDMSVEDIYALYDELVTNHPNYFFKKDDLGTDSSGQYNLRHYTLRMGNPYLSTVYNPADQSTNIWDDKIMVPRTICITSGLHGNEKCSVYGVYLAIKELLESNSAWAVFIKANFVLEICPIVNCWGVDNNSRNNFNAVNINRDFLEENPQAETILVKELIASCNNLHSVLDSHNSSYVSGIGSVNLGYLPTNKTFKYHNYYCQVAAKLASALYSRMSELFNRESQKPYIVAWYSGNNGTLMDYVNNQLGLIGGTLEAPNSDYGISEAQYNNNSKWCEVTKDLLINTIQLYGVQDYKKT